MKEPATHRVPQRLLVVMPTWVGDCVMATPTLRALRLLYPQAHISALIRSAVRPIIDACPWVDRLVTIRPRRAGMKDARRGSTVRLAARLALGRFDLAVLLPNSFRAALVVRLARIPRIVGYERDGRGFFLTERLQPLRDGSRFVPVSTRDYYLGIARYLGATHADPTMQLFTRPDDDRRGDDLLRRAGFDPRGDRPLVILNPGANYGDAKMWLPDRFAAVADRLAREHGCAVAISGAPKERAILDQVVAAAATPLLDLPKAGIDLTLLKSVMKRCRLLITNDTGPRHIAAALGVPVVTVFGPTDPAWSEIHFPLERQVSVPVFCGPCQKKKCPLDHRCMTGVSADMVTACSLDLLRSAAQSAH